MAFEMSHRRRGVGHEGKLVVDPVNLDRGGVLAS